jgi:hypothetical protein
MKEKIGEFLSDNNIILGKKPGIVNLGESQVYAAGGGGATCSPSTSSL